MPAENAPQNILDVKENNSFPFVGLQKSNDFFGPNAIFYDLPDHPELVVRKCFTPKEIMENIKEELQKSETYKNYTEEELEKIAKKKKIEQLIKNASEFQKIGERYGLKMAKTSYVIGTDPDSGEPDVFAVTERIVGENLDSMEFFSEQMAKEVDEMYVGLFSHLKDSYLENGTFWRDFRNDQVIYGSKIGKTELHPYIIDVDPLTVSWNDHVMIDGRENKEDLFWSRIGLAFINMEEIEGKNTSVKLKKAREMINAIIKTVPRSNNAELGFWYPYVIQELKK